MPPFKIFTYFLWGFFFSFCTYLAHLTVHCWVGYFLDDKVRRTWEEEGVRWEETSAKSLWQLSVKPSITPNDQFAMSLFVHDKYIYNSQTAISTVFLQSIHIMVSQSAHFQPVLLTDPSIKEQKKQTLCYKCFFFKLWVSLRLIKHFLFSLCVSLQLLSSNGETVEGTNGELHEKVKIEAWAEVDWQKNNWQFLFFCFLKTTFLSGCQAKHGPVQQFEK